MIIHILNGNLLDTESVELVGERHVTLVEGVIADVSESLPTGHADLVTKGKTCGTCHGIPTHDPRGSCDNCHGGSVNSSLQVIEGGGHIDGTVF